MTPQRLAEAADWIARRRLARQPIADLPGHLKPATEYAGYAVQALVRDRLTAAGGGAAIGWKVGATTPAMQRLLNVPAPCAGEMLAAGLRRGDARVAAADFTRLGVECEIAVELGAALGGAGQVDRVAAAAAVARIYPAAELVDDRYGDFRNFGVPALIADFFFHAGCVLGAPLEDWRRLDLARVTGTTSVDGVERLVGRGADVLGHPLDSLAWLANRLTALGRRLEPGAIVMTGSLPLPHWTAAGERVEIALSGIGKVTIEVV
jgi:2-keto-4-pentenoate hydratase